MVLGWGQMWVICSSTGREDTGCSKPSLPQAGHKSSVCNSCQGDHITANLPADWPGHPTPLQPVCSKCFCTVGNVIQITRKVNSSSRNYSGSFLEVMTLLEVPMRNRMGHTQQKVGVISACIPGSSSRFLLLSSSVTWPWDPRAKTGIWSQRVTLESLCWCQLQLGSHRRSLHCSCCHPGCARTDWKQRHQGWETRQWLRRVPKTSPNHPKAILNTHVQLWRSSKPCDTPAATHTVTSRVTQDTLPMFSFAHPKWGTDQKFQTKIHSSFTPSSKPWASTTAWGLCAKRANDKLSLFHCTMYFTGHKFITTADLSSVIAAEWFFLITISYTKRTHTAIPTVNRVYKKDVLLKYL